MGTPESYTIFGAGILSSVGESAACLAPDVKKLTLGVDCANTNYDITSMQPQLFVARDFDHLIDTLEAFADTMSFRTGGVEGAAKVRDSAQVGTIVLDSGLQISGVFTHTDASFLRTHGGTSLAYRDTLLVGHGTETHSDGFSTPLGRLRGLDMPLCDADEGDLLRIGVAVGQSCTLTFHSGYAVKGTLVRICRKEGRNLLLSFRNCTVTDPSGAVVFHPEWGGFDMAVGERIVSAYSGSADKEAHNVYPPKSTKTAIKIEYSDEERRLFSIYEAIRAQRDSGSLDLVHAGRIAADLDASFSDAWLAYLELYELLKRHAPSEALTGRVDAHLRELRTRNEEWDDLIGAGYRFLA
jgi:phenylalanine-4-hydroxylase